MLFYRAEGVLVNRSAENDDSRRAQRENARKILIKSEEVNQKRGRDSFCFVADLSDGFLTAGMITDRAEAAESVLKSFLKKVRWHH